MVIAKSAWTRYARRIVQGRGRRCGRQRMLSPSIALAQEPAPTIIPINDLVRQAVERFAQSRGNDAGATLRANSRRPDPGSR